LFLFPFNLKQCGLRCFRKVTRLLGLFTLAGHALAVTGAISKQIERVGCESVFMSGNVTSGTSLAPGMLGVAAGRVSRVSSGRMDFFIEPSAVIFGRQTGQRQNPTSRNCC
jgi:hypothetical protein